MFLKEKNLGMSSEEPCAIPLFKTVFDRKSKDEHHRDVPAREHRQREGCGFAEGEEAPFECRRAWVLKRGMAHGSAEGQT
jgi:hypothetical protein